MTERILLTPGLKILLTDPTFLCKKHGEVLSILSVHGDEYGDMKGDYCQLCVFENLAQVINKLEKVEKK